MKIKLIMHFTSFTLKVILFPEGKEEFLTNQDGVRYFCADELYQTLPGFESEVMVMTIEDFRNVF